MFDQIEKLKQDLTDKYVVVDASLPELARFEGHVGQVKTVNMNGRALVQFDAWANIGWYDIDVPCLKVVPKPEAGAEGKKEAKKPEAKAAAKPAAAAPAGEKKLSPIEMARMQGAAKSGGAPAAKPAPAAGAKQSTADILAAARANKASSAPAAPAEAATPSEEPVVAAPKAAAKPAPTAAPAAKPGERLSVSQMLAYCRQHDTK